jgi:hypothetical protein
MGDDCRFEISEECRIFGEASFDERRRVAKDFIQVFTEQVAPSKELGEPNEEWTNCVRGRFIDICPSDCCALPKVRFSAKGEFLVDYIWHRWEDEENGRRLILAGESEWGADRYGGIHWDLVEEDFEKLLVIKAPFKVLIFSSNLKMGDSEGAEQGDYSLGFAKRKVEASLRNYGHHIAGEVYIFIDFPRTGDPNSPGEFRSFIWISRSLGRADGKLEDALGGELIRPRTSPHCSSL